MARLPLLYLTALSYYIRSPGELRPVDPRYFIFIFPLPLDPHFLSLSYLLYILFIFSVNTPSIFGFVRFRHFSQIRHASAARAGQLPKAGGLL